MKAIAASTRAYFGSPGTGKTASMYQAIMKARPKRLMILDPEEEFSSTNGRYFINKPVSSLEEARKQLVDAKGGPFTICYVPSGDTRDMQKKADVFCKLAFAVGNVDVLVDELHLFTTSGWAPAGWKDL